MKRHNHEHQEAQHEGVVKGVCRHLLDSPFRLRDQSGHREQEVEHDASYYGRGGEEAGQLGSKAPVVVGGVDFERGWDDGVSVDRGLIPAKRISHYQRMAAMGPLPHPADHRNDH